MTPLSDYYNDFPMHEFVSGPIPEPNLEGWSDDVRPHSQLGYWLTEKANRMLDRGRLAYQLKPVVAEPEVEIVWTSKYDKPVVTVAVDPR